MYTERYSLPFLSGVLIAAMERLRPGLGPWTRDSPLKLKEAFDAELIEMRRRFFELFDDRGYWDRLERGLVDTCLPRYLVVAEKQTQLEAREYGVWRGGDLIARATFAVAGLVVGIVMVEVPYIPIPESWKLFSLATMLAAPFIPEAQVWWHKRRYRKALAAVVKDMKEAEDHLKLYQPLQEAVAGPRPVMSPVDPQVAGPVTPSGERNRQGGGHG